MDITTRQAAELIQQHLNQGAPAITSDKVGRLVATGVLQNVSTTNWNALDHAKVENFAQRTRYVPRHAFPYKRAMRVSVIPMWANRIILPSRQKWRDWAGIDHANSRHLTAQEIQRAWTGVWRVSDATADSVTGCPLLASNWGYVHPDLCGIITGWWREPTSGRVVFDIAPDPDLAAVIGAGIWVDIPAGSTAAPL